MSRVVVAVVVAVAVALVPSAPRRSPLGIVAYGPGHDYERAAEDEFLDNFDEADVDTIDELLAERLQYKKKRLFDDADRIRDVLAAEHGVSIWDKDGVWTTGGKNPTDSGRGNRGGGGAAFECSGGADHLDAEALTVIARRIVARADAQRRRDFSTADTIRTFLQETYEVEVDDRTKSWSVVPGGVVFVVRAYTKSPSSELLPAGLDEETIDEMVNERAEAKRRREFERADDIRDDLIDDFGVHINDKTKEWSVGRNFGPASSKSKGGAFERRGGGQLTAAEVDMVALAVNERVKAKKNNNFDLADAIRDELSRRYNVKVDDENREWRVMADAYARAWNSPKLARESDAATVDQLVLERGGAKRRQDYDAADQILVDLMDRFDVKIDDRVHEWTVFQNDADAPDLAHLAAAARLVEPHAEIAQEFEAELANDHDTPKVQVEAAPAAQEPEPPLVVAVQAAQADDAHEEAAQTDEDLESLTVPDLKIRLKARGLKVSGRKSELIDRLRE